MEYIVINGKLYHHGTKGMKWYKRLYQHKDGSLTALGRIRYRKKGPPDKSTDSTNDAAKTLKKEEPRKISKNPKKMSDAELVSAVDRLNLQKRYKDLNKEVNMSRPRKFVGDFIDKAAMPAAIEAGKKVLTDKLTAVGKKALGLNDEQVGDVLKELKKEAETLELKAKIAKNKDYLDKRNAKNAADKAQAEQKTKDDTATQETAKKNASTSYDNLYNMTYGDLNKRGTVARGKTVYDDFIDMKFNTVSSETIELGKRGVELLDAPK